MTQWKTTAEPLFYSIEQAVEASGVSRTMLYLWLQEGKLKARKSGRRTLILRTELVEYMDSLPSWKSKA